MASAADLALPELSSILNSEEELRAGIRRARSRGVSFGVSQDDAKVAKWACPETGVLSWVNVLEAEALLSLLVLRTQGNAARPAPLQTASTDADESLEVVSPKPQEAGANEVQRSALNAPGPSDLSNGLRPSGTSTSTTDQDDNGTKKRSDTGSSSETLRSETARSETAALSFRPRPSWTAINEKGPLSFPSRSSFALTSKRKPLPTSAKRISATATITGPANKKIKVVSPPGDEERHAKKNAEMIGALNRKATGRLRATPCVKCQKAQAHFEKTGRFKGNKDHPPDRCIIASGDNDMGVCARCKAQKEKCF